MFTCVQWQVLDSTGRQTVICRTFACLHSPEILNLLDLKLERFWQGCCKSGKLVKSRENQGILFSIRGVKESKIFREIKENQGAFRFPTVLFQSGEFLSILSYAFS